MLWGGMHHCFCCHYYSCWKSHRSAAPPPAVAAARHPAPAAPWGFRRACTTWAPPIHEMQKLGRMVNSSLLSTVFLPPLGHYVCRYPHRYPDLLELAVVPRWGVFAAVSDVDVAAASAAVDVDAAAADVDAAAERNKTVSDQCHSHPTSRRY